MKRKAGYNLEQQTIDLIESLAEKEQRTRSMIVERAVSLYAKDKDKDRETK